MTDDDKRAVRERYERAVASLTETLRRDRTVLAAILCGSLAYDEVWEKSDIDLLIVGDESYKDGSFALTEEGVDVHATIHPRSSFKKTMQGSLQSSFFHSYVVKGRLLFSHDDSIRDLYDSAQTIGDRDRTAQLLRCAPEVLWALPKAEKWLFVKHDTHYSLYYILRCAEALARLEVVAAGQLAGREVLQQAIRLNPTFFHAIYSDLIDGPKDEPTLQHALAAINAYLDARITTIFAPILDYLAASGAPCRASEVDAHFRNQIQAQGISTVCEWLSAKGVIEKVALPLRLSPKSTVAMPEAAYYYDPEAR